jgi:hypothetical protein
MAKVNVKLTSLYSKRGDKFEFYHGYFKIDNSHAHAQTGFTDLKKFALDILFEVAYNNLENPEYEVRLFTGEDYLGDFRVRYTKKPSEEEKRELIKNINDARLNRRAKSLAQTCLKNKKISEIL